MNAPVTTSSCARKTVLWEYAENKAALTSGTQNLQEVNTLYIVKRRYFLTKL